MLFDKQTESEESSRNNNTTPGNSEKQRKHTCSTQSLSFSQCYNLGLFKICMCVCQPNHASIHYLPTLYFNGVSTVLIAMEFNTFTSIPLMFMALLCPDMPTQILCLLAIDILTLSHLRLIQTLNRPIKADLFWKWNKCQLLHVLLMTIPVTQTSPVSSECSVCALEQDASWLFCAAIWWALIKWNSFCMKRVITFRNKHLEIKPHGTEASVDIYFQIRVQTLKNWISLY